MIGTMWVELFMKGSMEYLTWFFFIVKLDTKALYEWYFVQLIYNQNPKLYDCSIFEGVTSTSVADSPDVGVGL